MCWYQSIVYLQHMITREDWDDCLCLLLGAVLSCSRSSDITIESGRLAWRRLVRGRVTRLSQESDSGVVKWSNQTLTPLHSLFLPARSALFSPLFRKLLVLTLNHHTSMPVQFFFESRLWCGFYDRSRSFDFMILKAFDSLCVTLCPDR